MTTAPTDGVTGWAVDLIDTLGGPGAGLVVALENVFPPLPSEVLLPLAGLAAQQGRMSLAEALLWTTLGSVAGAAVLYGLGAAFGRDRVVAVAVRLPLVKGGDVDRAEAWFARHGAKAVFLGRMVPLVRSLVSLPAGVERMAFGRFLAYTAAGSFLWNAALVGAGYLSGTQWHLVERYVGRSEKVLVAGAAAAAAWFVLQRVREARGAASVQ